jgi:hypothetical protein
MEYDSEMWRNNSVAKGSFEYLKVCEWYEEFCILNTTLKYWLGLLEDQTVIIEKKIGVLEIWWKVQRIY